MANHSTEAAARIVPRTVRTTGELPLGNEEHDSTEPPMQRGLAGNGHLNARLPNLELIKFNGSQEQWQEFRIRFESLVHNNSYLTSNAKMSYLTAVLTGEAAVSIKGLQLTGDMYDPAVRMLKERFRNPNSLIQFHFRRLLSVQAVRSSRNVPEL